MTAQHTPGPWTAPSAGIFAATDERVACIEPLRCPTLKANGGSRNVEMAANARLIAAAPDLLAACRELLEHVEYCAINHYLDDPIGGSFPSVDLARAAIAKATGNA